MFNWLADSDSTRSAGGDVTWVRGVDRGQHQSFPGNLNCKVGSRRPTESVPEQWRSTTPALSFVSLPSRWCPTCVNVAVRAEQSFHAESA